MKRQAIRYGAMTMVALAFANALQQGEASSFSQATDGIRHAFHVSDFALGTVPFFMGLGGALGSVPISFLSSRYRRTAVLGGMFLLWAVLMGVNGLLIGFAAFYVVRLLISVTEATDPAALPLLADYYPVDERAAKASVFNAGAGLGGFLGIGLGGLLVDQFGWRWAFLMWVPIGLLGAALIRSRREPPRGGQDAAFESELEELAGDEERLVVDVVEAEVAQHEPFPDPSQAGRREIFACVWRLRSWRTACIAIGVSQIVQNGLMFWGPAFFKRTFHLNGTDVAALAPVLGAGSFVGLLGGGYLADRLLRRGVLLARVWVSGLGFAAAGVCLIAAFATRSLVTASVFLGLGSLFGAIPTGPAAAVLLDVIPSTLRSQSASLANLVQFCSALGYPLIGGLSTLFGDNLRLALLCSSPIYVGGGLYLLGAGRTYVSDVARVVAHAQRHAVT